MKKTPTSFGANVVQLPVKPAKKRKARATASRERGVSPNAGGSHDPRMQQALRMAKAFLAVEDATARDALIDLAERLAERDGALRSQVVD